MSGRLCKGLTSTLGSSGCSGRTSNELDSLWQRDLESIIRHGIASSNFEVADTGFAVETVSSLLDGIAVRMITGTPGLDRRQAIRLATAACSKLLCP